jgi:hypothetical protein
MSLPLEDRNNPLSGLEIKEQCQKLCSQGADSPPWKIFSLDRHNYTEEELKKAYRQLALRFHPDKNPDVLNIAAAFNIIGDAYQYMAYTLKSAPDKEDEAENIRHNPFFQKYYSPVSLAFNGFWTTAKKKSYEEMSFVELLPD